MYGDTSDGMYGVLAGVLRLGSVIRTWEREGVVAQRYGRIVVLDDVRLRELADT